LGGSGKRGKGVSPSLSIQYQAMEPFKGYQAMEPFKGHQTMESFRSHQAMEPPMGHQALEPSIDHRIRIFLHLLLSHFL